MRNGYKITLGILAVLILITLTIGTSYSYYSVSYEQTEANELATTCFDFSFQDSNAINLNADGSFAYPMSEESALSKFSPYQFTVTNTCDTGVALKYDVTINTLTSPVSTLTDSLRYKLDITAPTAVSGTSALLTSKYDSAYELGANIKTTYGVDTSYRLDSGTLAPGETKSYQLYLWIDESAGNDIMGKNFEGLVLLYAYM